MRPSFFCFILGIFMLSCGQRDLLKAHWPVLQDYKLTSTAKGRFAKKYIYENENSKLIMQVTPDVKSGFADKMIDADILNVKMVYAEEISPYPGFVSYKREFDPELVPQYFEKDINGRKIRYFIMYANDRYSLGITSKNSISYRYLMGWLYEDSSETLYKIRIFLPKGAAKEDMEKLLFSYRN